MMVDQVFVARVDGSDVTHLGAYLADGGMRAVCLPADVAQAFTLVRASTGERLSWCGDCEAYRVFLATDAIARQPIADVVQLPAAKRPRGRVHLPDPRTA